MFKNLFFKWLPPFLTIILVSCEKDDNKIEYIQLDLTEARNPIKDYYWSQSNIHLPVDYGKLHCVFK